MRTPRNREQLILALIGSFLVVLSFGADAATKTWTGGGANANWTTALNWSPSGAPASGDDLVFPAGGLRPTNNNDTAAATSYNTISFTGPVGGYSLQGNAIQLAAGITANNSASNLISLDITLTAPQTFVITGDRLQIFGTVNLGANTLAVNNATFPSVIEFDGPVTGTGGLTATGIGFVYIQATCTYSGPTNIGGGIFGVAGGSLSTASAVSVTGAGAHLQLMNGVSVGPVTVGPGATLSCGVGGISQVGSVTDLTMQSGSTFELQMNSSSDYGQLNVSGTATLGGASLFMNWAYTSASGTAFKIINKTSPGAVSGTFNGLAEGAVFTDNGRTYWITYAGGDGNDVVITDGLPNESPRVVPTLGAAGLAALGVLLALSALFALRRAA
ncbi:MAG: hypothetical protein ACHQPI_14160 [Thermoanaerobaculia bacterium]